MDWNLLACARYGHVSFAPDEPGLRAQMHARLPDGGSLVAPDLELRSAGD